MAEETGCRKSLDSRRVAFAVSTYLSHDMLQYTHASCRAASVRHNIQLIPNTFDAQMCSQSITSTLLTVLQV